jgi:alpha-tubulin suppressor-like RCC1 family protein
MDGRLGTGDSVNRLRPNRAGGFSFTEISAGADHTCALQSSGQVRCWGRDADEQLGNGAGTESNTPALVSGDRNYRSVSAGTLHTCAVETAGLLFCWGGGPAGQTGRPPGAGRNSVPSQVGTETSWLDVAAGVAHTCARFGDGEVFCFGNNARGALGTGDDIAVDGPTAVEGGVQMSQLSAGNQFTCGVAPGGELYCWGQNDVGQLGVGDRMDRMSPTRVCFGE